MAMLQRISDNLPTVWENGRRGMVDGGTVQGLGDLDVGDSAP